MSAQSFWGALATVGALIFSISKKDYIRAEWKTWFGKVSLEAKRRRKKPKNRSKQIKK
jgi:hypothetical protein